MSVSPIPVMTWAGVSSRRSRTRMSPGLTWSLRRARWGAPGQDEEVVAFVEGQVQAAGDGGDHLFRGLRAALAFDAAVVVSGHVAQRGDLFAAEPAGTPAGAVRQSDVLRLQRLAAFTQEIRQFGAVHCGPPFVRSGPAVYSSAARGR